MEDRFARGRGPNACEWQAAIWLRQAIRAFARLDADIALPTGNRLRCLRPRAVERVAYWRRMVTLSQSGNHKLMAS